ncbi:unnamed protein product, partial [Effrenium voratum]
FHGCPSVRMALTVRQTKREATQTLLLGGCSGNLLSLNRCFASCEKHPESDKLLVEQIDIGEEVPRQICSGIGAFFEPDQVVGKKVVIVSNLKARKMAGTASEGMLLCASKSEGEELRSLDLVQAPEEAPLGERIVVEVDDEEHGEPAAPNRVGKKKLYEKVAGELKTNADGTVCFKDSPFMTSAGPCTAKAMPDAVVS